MRYSIVCNSVIGSRKSNQDRVAYAERDNSVLMVIADGLGGYAGGEIAAQTLADTIIGFYKDTNAPLINDPAAFIVLSISYAHSMINQQARASGIDANLPRTTCVVCLVQNGYAYWGHVGDSRLYLINDDEVIIRTVDHSTADHKYQDNVIGEQDQRLGPGQLFRCVGGSKRPLVSLGPETHLATGDTLLLCTDGVWRAFRDRQLLKIVTQPGIEDGLDDLLNQSQAYFERDGDNMTALLFRWEDAPSRQPPLLKLTTPELDQEQLWQELKQRSGRGGRDRNDVAKEEIDSIIEEIESFVKDVDTWL